MDDRCKFLLEQGDSLFSKRSPILTLWQNIADQFYPERAEFTVTRSLGEEFADNLYDSYPLIVRRELGDFLSTLRRKDQEWFEVSIDREDRLDDAGRKWLEGATKVQRNAMYDRYAQFTRSMKETDHDYVTFGNAVLTVEANHITNRLLYQSWHLRDVVWMFTVDGRIAQVHRKWLPTARQLSNMFKDRRGASLHQNVVKLLDKQPLAEVDCRHIVVSVDEYKPEKLVKGQKFCELYIDVQNKHLIWEGPLSHQKYVIPRWKTVSGSQYAHSPAVVCGLPDARLIQAMSLTLLEAGEMAVRPPLVMKEDAISTLKWFHGGVSTVDAEFDGRLGDAVAPVNTTGKDALPFSLDMLQSKQAMLSQAFYINKIALPQFSHEMTAFEFSQRLQEYIRNVIPLFEPIDSEYHAQVCDETFQVLLNENAFARLGPPPRSVAGSETVYKFDSPLSQATERQKGQQFLEAKELVTQAMEMDPACGAMIDFRVALRDALAGKRTPATWTRDEQAVEAHSQQITQQQMAEKQAALMQRGADVLKTAGEAGKALSEAEAA